LPWPSNYHRHGSVAAPPLVAQAAPRGLASLPPHGSRSLKSLSPSLDGRTSMQWIGTRGRPRSASRRCRVTPVGRPGFLIHIDHG
jgi:hypothetical protein